MKKFLTAFILAALTIVSISAAAADSELTGSWEGWYYAAQGQTGLTLTINENNTGAFEFYNMPGRSNAKSGSDEVSVNESGGVGTVTAGEWIEEAPG